MTTASEIEVLQDAEYKYGFVTDIDVDEVPPGLTEDTVRLISAKKNEPEWLLEWRLEAYRHWLTLEEPNWQKVEHEPIDYQSIVYYSAPKAKPKLASMDEVDPELRATLEKLGIPLQGVIGPGNGGVVFPARHRSVHRRREQSHETLELGQRSRESGGTHEGSRFRGVFAFFGK